MTTAQGLPIAPPIQITSVGLALLRESPTNKRRTWGNLEELADSIRAVGILEPLLARPDPQKAGLFELVFGHRRLRAGKLAKIASAPVIVRELTDAQAVEIQAIENLQRTDLHPLEEAEGFEQLQGLGYSVEDLAAKLGKSKAYVYARLKLLDLVPEAREAFYAGKLSASVALLVARVPAAMQPLALNDLDEKANDLTGAFPMHGKNKAPEVDPLGARAAASLLRAKYMLKLELAPFSREDADLLPAAGSCLACPKRSGNQKELFGDVGTPDLCTDPTCFAEKKKTHAAALAAKLEARGVKVVEAKEALGFLHPPPGYVLPSAIAPNGKTFGVLADKAKKKLEGPKVMMIDGRGKAVELLKRAEVLEAAGVHKDAPRSSSSSSVDWEARQKAERLKQDGDDLGDANAMIRLLEEVEKKPFTDPLLRILCFFAGGWNLRAVAERRGWNPSFEDEIAKLKGDNLRGLLVEAILQGSDASGRDPMVELCAHFKIDLAAHRKKGREAVKAAEKVAAAEAEKKGATKGRKK